MEKHKVAAEEAHGISAFPEDKPVPPPATAKTNPLI
jgi:hypothetical protein